METDTKTNKEVIHIGLDFPENFLDIAIYKVTEDIQASGLKLKVHKHPRLVALAALDWVVPTVIAAYVFKPYFESFLEEAGKDHYKILKAWLKKFAENGRLIAVHRISAMQSTEKNVSDDNQSKSVSLLIQTKNGKIIKLLFDNDLTKEDWDSAIDQLLDFAIDNYEKFPNDKLSQVLKELEPEHYLKVYAIVDKSSKQLLFYDNKGLMRLHKEQSDKLNSNDASS